MLACADMGCIRNHDVVIAGLKVDSCGVQKNVSEYAALFNTSGRGAVLLENCHEGTPSRDTKTGRVTCNMNLFRTSGKFLKLHCTSVLSHLDSADGDSIDSTILCSSWHAFPLSRIHADARSILMTSWVRSRHPTNVRSDYQ